MANVFLLPWGVGDGRLSLLWSRETPSREQVSMSAMLCVLFELRCSWIVKVSDKRDRRRREKNSTFQKIQKSMLKNNQLT